MIHLSLEARAHDARSALPCRGKNIPSRRQTAKRALILGQNGRRSRKMGMFSSLVDTIGGLEISSATSCITSGERTSVSGSLGFGISPSEAAYSALRFSALASASSVTVTDDCSAANGEQFSRSGASSRAHEFAVFTSIVFYRSRFAATHAPATCQGSGSTARGTY